VRRDPAAAQVSNESRDVIRLIGPERDAPPGTTMADRASDVGTEALPSKEGALFACCGRVKSCGDRGVYVPDGMTATEIIEGAHALVRDFELDTYTARNMVRTVLLAVRGGTKESSDTLQGSPPT
jgi:hypothetical protein